MLRSAFLAAVLVAAGSSAAAQEAGDDVNFVLRPTEAQSGDILDVFPADPDDEDAAEQRPAAAPPLAGPTGEEPIGAPLAGPTGEEPIGSPLAGPASPAAPAAPGLPSRSPRRGSEADPFAATGVELGSFVIRPAIEIGVNATDNPAGDSEGETAIGFLVAPEIVIRSEDSDHEIEAAFRGEGIFYQKDEFDEREGEARVRGRYDLTGSTSLEGEAVYSYSLDSFDDPDTPDAAAERPAVESVEAEFGGTQRFGPLAIGATGAVDRTVNEDVALAGGRIASRRELDNTEYEARVRASYEASGAMTPYAEVEAGRRNYDQEVDDNGFERASIWGELRGGLIVDLGSKLDGEVVVGYRHEDIEDERLDDIDAVVAAASVMWSPRRLTEIRVALSTDVRPTSVSDASGSLIYSATITALRRVSARLGLEAGLGFDRERFIGIDRSEDTFSGFAGVSYALNRSASLEARYVHERSDGTEPDDDSKANTVTLRIRLQR